MHKEAAIDTYRALHSDDWPQWPYGNLTIMHDGSGWNGTFGIVAYTALSDVLSDGDGVPIDEVIVVEEGHSRGIRNIIRGTVESVTPNEITFHNTSLTVEMENVLAVSF